MRQHLEAGSSESLAYFTEGQVGGSGLTITYGHVVDFLMDVLGDFEQHIVKSTTSIQRLVVIVPGAQDKLPFKMVQLDGFPRCARAYG